MHEINAVLPREKTCYSLPVAYLRSVSRSKGRCKRRLSKLAE
jgi:hypothetical protein